MNPVTANAQGRATPTSPRSGESAGDALTARQHRQARQQVVLIAAALVVAVLASYWSVHAFGFLTFDDLDYLNHPHVRAGLTWRGAWWALTGVHFANWHPLTTLSYMLERTLWGDHARPYHVANVLLHAANSVLLFWVLRRLCHGATYRSAFTAALFALHPLHVESVAWVAERKDVLSALFWLLTMWAYACYAERPSLRRYLTVALLFSLGLMSKPMVVTLPFVLLLLDVWPLRRVQARLDRAGGLGTTLPLKWGAAVLEKVPLLALSAASAIITLLAQRAAGAMASIERVPISYRLGNALVSYVRYLGKTLWPLELSAIYPLPDWHPAWMVGASAVLLCFISAVAMWQLRRRPYIFCGWFWFLGTLVPVIGLIQVGSQAMADRYTYIPLIGVFIVVSWGVHDLLIEPARRRNARVVSAAATAAAVILIACAVLTWRQVQYWRSGETLFLRAVEVEPDSPLARYNLASALHRRGEHERAIEHLEVAIRLENFHKNYHLLGQIHAACRDYDRAIAAYRDAVQLKPDFADSRNDLGWLLVMRGDLAGAEEQLKEAVRLAPDYPQALLNLGLLRARQKRFSDAERHFARLVELRPNDDHARHQLGIALQVQGRLPEAVIQYRRAVELNPASLARNNLAWILATSSDPQLRNGAEAVRLAEALQENVGDGSPEVLDTLAAAYAEAGEFEKATQAAAAALQAAATTDKPELRRQIRERLHGYEQRRPYRETQ